MALRCFKNLKKVTYTFNIFKKIRSPVSSNYDKTLTFLYYQQVNHYSKDPTVKNLENKTSLNSDTHVKSSELLENAITDELRDIDPEFPSDINEDWNNFNKGYRDQSRHSFRPNIDPRETSVILFPGQGTQFVGMGEKLLPYPGVQEIYDQASDILGYDLLELCLKGPQAKLNRTVYCQPAVYVTSIAAIEKLKDDNPQAIENCIATSGFSVGEYASLVFAGALTFEDGLEIVKVRAEEMQKASEEVPSGMMTVFLAPDAKINKACHFAKMYCKDKLNIEQPVCEIANYLYPDCKVVAGNKEALDFLEKNKKEFGIKRIKHLPVSGAFHTALMRPSIPALRDILQKVEFEEPVINVHANIDSFKYRKRNFNKNLIKQVYSPVKWEQTLHVLYARKQGVEFPYTYEMGPGRQLGAMLKMTNLKAYEQYTAVEV